VMRQPPSQWLPTVRFVPERDAPAPTVARRPEHLLLLLLRVVLILCIGAAFAQPVWEPRRQPVHHLVAIDRSRAVVNMRQAADSANAVLRDGSGTLIVFDSAAHATDTLGTLTRSGAPGSISAALVVALQTASRVRDHAESLDLTIVSPFGAGETDAATDSIRALWPGAIRLIPLAARGDSASVTAVVQWPSDGHAPGTVARATPDTVGAVVAAGLAVVAPFERRWRFAAISAPGTHVVARWVDGEPAAVEHDCKRDVAIAAPAAGDVVLRPEYERLVQAMHAPCGRSSEGDRIGDLASLRGDGPARIATRAIAPLARQRAPLVPWLLGAALLAALGELAIRRRSAA
jgi:hypothetical protein